MENNLNPAPSWPADFLSLAYSRIAFPLLRRSCGVNPLTIYYHIVGDHEVSHISNLYTFRNVSQFKRDMDVLLKYFRPLALPVFLAFRRRKEAPPRNSFMLTFDDGLRECYEVIAPILERRSIPATFFLCSAFVDNRDMAYDLKKSLLADLLRKRSASSVEERRVRAALAEIGQVEASLSAAVLRVDYGRKRVLDEIAKILDFDFSAYLKTASPYLTSEQVRELLRMGHSVGAHSIDHPRFADVSLAEQIHQTLESVRFVREKFSVDYGAFSFPHSDARISQEFFREIFATGEVDICFGNQGLLEDSVPGNLQRTSMERTMLPAEGILGRSYARRFAKALAGELVVRRT